LADTDTVTTGGALVGDAFYEPLGDGRYRATGHTAGPWSADSQHMGPPAALLARELERCAPREDVMLSRLVFEVLGPVPLGELTVSSRVERAGRSVELLSAELQAAGRAVVRAHAWRIAQSDTGEVAAGAPAPLDPPEAAGLMPIPAGWGRGYLDAVEWRSLDGGMTGSGHATVWGRALVDLVAGEAGSALQRLCAVADSANGVSSRLEIDRWLFINTDLTLHLYRRPAGEWFALDAVTVIGPTGVGATDSVLHDAAGPVGRGAQSLLVRPR
jgi:hypothetical protein